MANIPLSQIKTITRLKSFFPSRLKASKLRAQDTWDFKCVNLKLQGSTHANHTSRLQNTATCPKDTSCSRFQVRTCRKTQKAWFKAASACGCSLVAFPCCNLFYQSMFLHSTVLYDEGSGGKIYIYIYWLHTGQLQ